MKKIFFAFLLFTLFTILSAHEFWLQPEKFIYNQGECVNIRFNIGENYIGENWKGDQSKIETLDFYFDNWHDTLSPRLLNEKGDSLQIAVMDEGTAMVAFSSKNSFIEWDAVKFNNYLNEDGLMGAIEYRNHHNETDSVGREFYQRNVKTIFQIGEKKSNAYTQVTKLPLDIIPQSNPYAQKNGNKIIVKILFQKEPLINSVIKVWHRVDSVISKIELQSDENGAISFDMETTGEWMISCQKMIRLESNPQAQWQSYWGSCTWGYQ